MPYVTITARTTVPSEQAALAQETLESALDQLAVQEVPTVSTEVTEECADAPTEGELD